MQDRDIILRWKRNDEFYEKVLDRRNVQAVFESLILNHPENCTVSTRIVKNIPDSEEMLINWDDTKDVNSLYLKINGAYIGIPIIAHHKIVWGVLRKWCDIW